MPAQHHPAAPQDAGAGSRRAMIRALGGADHYGATWLDLGQPSRADIDSTLAEVRAAADGLLARLLAARERAP
jgi:hypothetical protein